jgi:long-chain acyl-CoA synthetase
MSLTIYEKFLETAKKHSDRIAIMFSRGGRWNELTWNGYLEVVEGFAAGLQSIGIKKGDRIALLSNSRFEWAVTDLAALGLGAVVVPIYQNSTSEDIAFILGDSGAKLVVCESIEMAQNIRANIGSNSSSNSNKSEGKSAATLKEPAMVRTTNSVTSSPTSVTTPLAILCFENHKNLESEGFLSFHSVQKSGESIIKKSPLNYRLAVEQVSLDDVATILYTSGTTGQPKGVMLTHTQIMSEVGDAFPLLGVTHRDRFLSFLPFAHVLGRIEIWGHALIGYTLAFAESIDLLKKNLVEIKPTIMISVPRIFEKIYNGIIAQVELSPIKSKTFWWAISVGREISKYKIEKKPVPLTLALQYQLARRLVFDAITERIGGRLRFSVCGGAPLAKPIAEFFHAVGILILEGYGLTETTAAIAVNTPYDYRFGTVGRPIGDVKVKIADDGEILVHSKKVMKNYYNDPAATERAFTDGWFHTGDIGELSDDGFLRITDRKKDLIKTAGGKYVAPQRLEGFLKINRYISQVHIHGDKRKYVVALVTLDQALVKIYAQEIGLPHEDYILLTEQPEIKELARQAVAEANAHLASFESIKSFAIVPREFTVESGELTPSLKVKRKAVDQNYRDLIEHLYGHERSGKD